MAETTAARRMTLLYQLWVTNQAARQFMRLALAETDMSGEEYALSSYLYGNGPRTLSQTARDLGMPITTVATLFAPLVDRGEVARRSHPTDGRARLLSLTDQGRERLEHAIPAFTVAYRSLLEQLQAAGVDVEAVFRGLDQLRVALETTGPLIQSESPRP